MITHYDLFAGIGGFSLALEEVFTDAEIKHVFCEWEQFPTAVLRRHWPDGEFYGDIADLVADTDNEGLEESRHSGWTANDAKALTEANYRLKRQDSTHTDAQYKGLEGRQPEHEAEGRHEQLGRSRSDQEQQGFTIVTGGFPCQPFSHAGRRKGTADDRYQWPNMFAVIRNTKPEWVIAENVRGLVTWNDGLVLETVCTDLESEGYEVQPFIIPAVAVGAPHRRDRVWIIAHAKHDRSRGTEPSVTRSSDSISEVNRTQHGASGQPERADSDRYNNRPDAYSESLRRGAGMGLERQSDTETTEQCGEDSNATDTGSIGRKPGRIVAGSQSPQIRGEGQRKDERSNVPDWNRSWQEVAFATCNDSVDDGLSRLVDGVSYSRAKWRKDSLKAYGNGIVHQVATEIFRGIRESIK